MPDLYAPLDYPSPSSSSNPRRVAYYYDPDVGNYVYYTGHPMKPHRIRMAHNLIVNYDLCDEMADDAPEEVGEGSRSVNGLGASLLTDDPANEGMDVDMDVPSGSNAVGGPSDGIVKPFTDAEKRLTNRLLTGARGKAMQIFRARRATKADMTRFHTDEYVDFLERVTPETAEAMTGGNVRCEFPSINLCL